MVPKSPFSESPESPSIHYRTQERSFPCPVWCQGGPVKSFLKGGLPWWSSGWDSTCQCRANATSFAELNSAAAAKSLQSCPTLCDPTDGRPPGFPIPGILQARTLEWVAISFSNAWKWKVKVKSLSCVQLLATPWTAAYQAPLSMDFPGKSTGVGCHCLLRN